MRVAVIGAGIVGVTTAFELSSDGHAVTVFERRGSVAEETSFANAGVVAPGYVTPWAAPGMPAKVLRHLLGSHAPVRLGRPWASGQLGWMWRWWRACSAPVWQANRARMHRLARYSQAHLASLGEQLRIDYEQSRGYLVLLRTPRDLAGNRGSLKLLAELGVRFHLVDGARARAIEPGLNPDTPLHAAVHLPDDGVGNCRQFAHLLRGEAQRLGAQFRFQRSVLAIEAGSQPQLRHADAAGLDARSEPFDAVVVCAALGSPALLKPLGLRLPLAPVHGYSISAPLRLVEGHPDFGPRAAVMDERFKVAISRLGQRVRVAGSAELGGRLDRHDARAIATLYKVLDDWYPGCAQLAQVQQWKGARPMLPDGPPLLGASGAPGVWLNLGHGSSGWALSCGSARVLADQIAGRTPAIDTEGLDISRLRRR
ncbi:D-amino acid dehydrogenase [Aquabacterium sp. OR-4]|uniref:D-amino acid dehydrogenase n=1 Tax=Aquabacterium sp. OR-4 TaxID=2978127 RepID=UPI0021B3CA25|nr:D-amino acid dehydrogenase [Aquabacterium sp. OR-4]MDT7835464.1 D-amino acid dehydrogenase [Aquabacterium sp. OR-4]